jgi:hypothetical protein
MDTMNAHPREFSPLGWKVRDSVEANERQPTRAEGIAYLTADNPRAACFSRFGSTSEDCAPVAWRLAFLLAREQGETITFDDLDHAMGLVVNGHDDVSYIIREYGRGWYGR